MTDGSRRRPEPSTRRSRRIGPRAAAFVRSLPDHPLLDRIVRGRAWIPLLGVMLAGIVATQVEVLKLGASVGRSVQRGTELASTNEQLQASVASLGDVQRIERLAAGMGMVMPAPAAVGFLAVRGTGVVGKAIANVHTPNAAGFLSLLTSNGAVVGAGGQSASAAGGALGAPTGATTTVATPTVATATGATATGATATGATATGATATGATPTAIGATATQPPGG